MTALQITVISAVIIFGFAAWLIALRASRKASVERWQDKYADKLNAAREARLAWFRREINRVKAELAVAVKQKKARKDIRQRLTDLRTGQLKLEAGQ